MTISTSVHALRVDTIPFWNALRLDHHTAEGGVRSILRMAILGVLVHLSPFQMFPREFERTQLSRNK